MLSKDRHWNPLFHFNRGKNTPHTHQGIWTLYQLNHFSILFFLLLVCFLLVLWVVLFLCFFFLRDGGVAFLPYLKKKKKKIILKVTIFWCFLNKIQSFFTDIREQNWKCQLQTQIRSPIFTHTTWYLQIFPLFQNWHPGHQCCRASLTPILDDKSAPSTDCSPPPSHLSWALDSRKLPGAH